MEVYTNQPGVQLYTGNWLKGSAVGKLNTQYDQFHGFCLETQKYPDTVHQPHFPTVILRPNETYEHVMVHRFSAHAVKSRL